MVALALALRDMTESRQTDSAAESESEPGLRLDRESAVLVSMVIRNLMKNEKIQKIRLRCICARRDRTYNLERSE
jgi:hypothetical protein